MESHYALLNSLKDEFPGYESKLRQLIQEVYSRVTRWKWATASQLQLALLRKERARVPKGRWLKERPENKVEYVKIGLDREDRIVVEEEYRSHPLHGHDRIYLHTQHYIRAFEYDKQKNLQRLEEAVQHDGKQTWYIGFAAGNRANSVDKYVYDQGRITAIESLWLTDFYVQTPTYYIGYNDTGGVESVRRVDPVSGIFPAGQDVYVFRKKLIAGAALTQRLVEETAKQICTALAGLHEPEPAYCLMLVLFGAFGRDDWFPPVLTLGLDSDRKRHADDPTRYWDAQHFKYASIALTGQELADYTQQFMQECELKHIYALPSIVLKKIAKELRRMEVEKLIFVTNDFVIVPFNCDSPSITASLKGVYTASEIKRLVANGLLLDEPA